MRACDGNAHAVFDNLVLVISVIPLLTPLLLHVFPMLLMRQNACRNFLHTATP